MNKYLAVLLSVVILVAFTFTVAGCPEEVPVNDNDVVDTVNNNDQVLPAELKGSYPDGRYRGVFHDRGIQQVGVQFHLEDNKLYDLSYRVLAHGGNNYLDPEHEDNPWPAEDLEVLTEQHKQLLEYLEGRDITEIEDLYTPEVAADDVEGTGEIVDTWTGATVRGTKIISAIRDGLNRGIY